MYGAVVNATPAQTLTERQRVFITKLCAERDVTVPANLDHFSKRYASEVIDRLLAMPKPQRAPKSAPTQGSDDTPVEDGMYIKEGVIYKVQLAIHGSGKPYAKRLVADEFGSSRFEYAPGVVHRLRPEDKLTKEEAKNWGALYGTCCRCGRTLTAEDSIERMMGPVCYGKMGW
jgi:hypothetical protein